MKNPNRKENENVERRNERNEQRPDEGRGINHTPEKGQDQQGSGLCRESRQDLQGSGNYRITGSHLSGIDTEEPESDPNELRRRNSEGGQRGIEIAETDKPGAVADPDKLNSIARLLAYHKFKFDELLNQVMNEYAAKDDRNYILHKMAKILTKMRGKPNEKP